ncbi:MAG: 4-(cytidine 5'-diphospho)-2-C-methyl-D-erythritol kinase [Treponema sp.]|jgi:4-diphosphocytidyl-2-C-methyl-D-erythritol kinase|nr:4-(cytidine 5'-diphospho)-2-C-methyl-D-erythritol kinase [Treponema sp.]
MSGSGLNLAINAPAKINLHLTVKSKRNDGFHDIESIFLALDYADTLVFEAGNKTLEIVMNSAGFLDIPVQNNIIFRAVSLFMEKTGFLQCFKITVDKKIPVGGGLGGGSSDAASALIAINKLSGGILNKDALLELGASLGSDIPFFLHAHPAAFVTGRGECIKVIPAPSFFIVLVNPGFPSDTASAYRLLDEYRINLSPVNSSIINGFEFFCENDWEEYFYNKDKWMFKNDFLAVFKKREKLVYERIIAALYENGAEYASLSGAGSTCFGIFFQKERAKSAEKNLSGKWNLTKFTFCGEIFG